MLKKENEMKWVKASCLIDICYIMSIKTEKYELLHLTMFDDHKNNENYVNI